jgi:tetratricopeptide (TPR) repeat protein
MFSMVLLVFAWIIQVWTLGSYIIVMPALAVSTFLSFFLFIKNAPLCSSCKKSPWTIFKRSAICCFAEKVSLRKTVQRTLKTFGVLYIVGGLATMYITNIITYGKMAKKYAEEQTRRPSYEKFLKEKKDLEKRIAENPEEPAPRMELGWLYYTTGNVRAAAKEYRKVIDLDPEKPNTNAMLMEAVLLGDMNQMRQEEDAYEKLLDLEPENTEALINVGLVYLRTKLADRAVVKLQKANKLLQEKVTAEDNKHKLQYKDSTDEIPEDPAELKAMKLHLAISYYHLAVASKLIQEDKQSSRALRLAKRYGMKTSNFKADVRRYKR